MGNFPGGSAWAMARDVAEGYVLLTDRGLQRLNRAELDQLSFELERLLRDLRGESVDLTDATALQGRNRKLLRLQQAGVVLRASRAARKS